MKYQCYLKPSSSGSGWEGKVYADEKGVAHTMIFNQQRWGSNSKELLEVEMDEAINLDKKQRRETKEWIVTDDDH